MHSCIVNFNPATSGCLSLISQQPPEKSIDLYLCLDHQLKSRKPEVLIEGSENTAVL